MTVLSYRRGQELPGVSLTWLRSNGDPLDLSTGYTFTVELVDRDDVAVVTKTSGVTGGVGAVSVAWAAGELDINPGSYRMLVVAVDGDGAARAFSPGNPPTVTIHGPAIA
jgi:hypothetical protein